jgi:hypothetical protein
MEAVVTYFKAIFRYLGCETEGNREKVQSVYPIRKLIAYRLQFHIEARPLYRQFWLLLRHGHSAQ